MTKLKTTPRAGWEQQFKKMAQAGDDELLDKDQKSTSWDETEWEWDQIK